MVNKTKRQYDEKGTSLIESAIVLGFLLLLYPVCYIITIICRGTESLKRVKTKTDNFCGNK